MFNNFIILFYSAMQQTITESRQIILTTTSVIIIATVIVGGSLLGSLLDILNIDTGIQENDQEMQPFSKNPNNSSSNFKPNDQLGSNLSKSFTSISAMNQNLDDKSWFIKMWYIFDCNLKALTTNSTNPTLIDTTVNCGFSNINFTGIASDGDLLADEQHPDRNSNYQRYSFENQSNFEENYCINENRQQLNEILEHSVGQLVQNSDGQQQIIFDRFTHNNQNVQTKSNKQSKS